MAAPKIKQIQGLQSALSAFAGIDTISETFTTSITNGDTGITITQSARESDNVRVHVNGQLLQEGYAWKKNSLIITAATLEAGTELVWDQTVTGFALESNDEIQIQYETEAGGAVNVGGQPATNYDDTSITSRATALENGVGVMSGHLIPDANEVYDIGSAAYKVRHLFLSDNSLNIGDQAVTLQDGKIHLPALKVGDDMEFTTNDAFVKIKWPVILIEYKTCMLIRFLKHVHLYGCRRMMEIPAFM